MFCPPSVGNVYIHPTANIDPTAVVIISCPASFKICACLLFKEKQANPIDTWIYGELYLFAVYIQLGPNVSIGTGVTIGAGVRVRESIILHGATLQVRHDLNKTE